MGDKRCSCMTMNTFTAQCNERIMLILLGQKKYA